MNCVRYTNEAQGLAGHWCLTHDTEWLLSESRCAAAYPEGAVSRVAEKWCQSGCYRDPGHEGEHRYADIPPVVVELSHVEALGAAIRDSWHSHDPADECWVDYAQTIKELAKLGYVIVAS